MCFVLIFIWFKIFSIFPRVLSTYTWHKLVFSQRLKGTVTRMSGALSLRSLLLSGSLLQNSNYHRHPELSFLSRTCLFGLGSPSLGHSLELASIWSAKVVIGHTLFVCFFFEVTVLDWLPVVQCLRNSCFIYLVWFSSCLKWGSQYI